MFCYHVSYGSDKRLVKVDSKADIVRCIKTEFRLDPGNILLQQWNAEFDDWVTITDTTQLPEKCKLNLVIEGIHSV
jgi:hypothetical protein